MHRIFMLGALVAGLASASAAPALAQSGFALKGGAVFNSSDVRSGEQYRMDPSDAAGFHAGAEVVLPLGLGVGISGYTAGHPSDFDVSSSSLVVLGEANYFLKLPFLPVAPYAGVHVGLGRYDWSDVEERQRPEVDLDDLGYQVGVRVQLSRMLGLDAQYRRVSYSLGGEQGTEFENNQVLVGVTLF